MKETILLIEDEIELQQNLKEILEFNGFSIVTADNGKEGLQKLEMHAIDLVLCDIMMPVMDGYQFLKAFRKIDRFWHIPFIFLSARAGAEDRSRGMTEGADDYLTKPISARMLLNSVSASLDKKKDREFIDLKESKNQRPVEVYGNQEVSPLKGLMDCLKFQKFAIDRRDWIEVIKQGEMALVEAKCLDSSIRKIDLYLMLPIQQNIPSSVFLGGLLEELTRKMGSENFLIDKNSPKPVLFDSHRLQFVLEELLENAIKFNEGTNPVLVAWDGSALEIKNQQKNLKYGEEVNIQPFGNLYKKSIYHAGLGLGLFLVKEYCLKNNSLFECGINREGDFSVRIQFDSKP